MGLRKIHDKAAASVAHRKNRRQYIRRKLRGFPEEAEALIREEGLLGPDKYFRCPRHRLHRGTCAVRFLACPKPGCGCRMERRA